MKIARIILTAVAMLSAAALFTPTAGATVTTTIGGSDGGGAFSWEISYDDATRQVTTTASGTGFCLVTVQLSNTMTRTVAYYPAPDAHSINGDLDQRMAAADFQVISDGSTTVLASGIAPNAVRRIVGKAGGTGGFISNSEWSRR